jgi:hypothetical protein
MKEIQLTNGGVTLVDNEDFNELKKYKWFAHREKSTTYVWRHLNGSRKMVKIHRQILNAMDSSIKIDHIDGNGLNNQRNNIRLCNDQQNSMNTKIRRDNSSGYKGVSYHAKNKKWRATINFNRRQISIGCYGNKEDAAVAYNQKAIELFGEFARPNVI